MSKSKHIEVLALIPARGGSKGVPRKCIKPLAGKPLIAYTIRAALASRVITRIVVSTDDKEIRVVAESFGAEVPFLRPAELAQDATPTLPVLKHAVSTLALVENYRPDIIVLLQPTSPLRQARHIDEAVQTLLDTGADSVVSLCTTKAHPYWLKQIIDDRVSDFYPWDRQVMRRQDLPPVYQLNGAIYVTRYRVLMEEDRILGRDTRPYLMDQYASIDIDTPVDFILAEALLKEMSGLE